MAEPDSCSPQFFAEPLFCFVNSGFWIGWLVSPACLEGKYSFFHPAITYRLPYQLSWIVKKLPIPFLM